MGLAADRIGLALALLVPAVCYLWIAAYGLLVKAGMIGSAPAAPAPVASDA